MKRDLSIYRQAPYSEDKDVRTKAMRAFLLAPSGRLRFQAPVESPSVGRETQSISRMYQDRVIKYKYLEQDLIEAEIGAFPIIYPYEDI